MRQPLTGGERNDDASVSRGPQPAPLAAKGRAAAAEAFLAWGTFSKVRETLVQDARRCQDGRTRTRS